MKFNFSCRFIKTNGITLVLFFLTFPLIMTHSDSQNSDSGNTKLVLDYSFVDGSGNVAVDKSGNKINSEIKGDPEWIGDPAMLYFNGETYTYLRNRKLVEKLCLQNFTISLWINPDSITSRDYRGVIRGPAGNGYRDSYAMFLKPESGTYSLIFNINMGDKRPVVIHRLPVSIPTGLFTHIAVTYNHRELAIHVNGKKVKTREENRDVVYSKDPHFCIGTSHGCRKFSGFINEFKLFDGVLSQEKIWDLASNIIFLEKNKEISEIQDPYPIVYEEDRKIGPDYNKCLNLVQNPSFENGLHFWEAEVIWPLPNIDEKNLYGIDQKTAHSGNKSLFIRSVKGGGRYYVKSFAIPLHSGKEYTYSFYAKADKPGVTLDCLVNSGKHPVHHAFKRIKLTDKWERYSMSFKAVNNAGTPLFKFDNRYVGKGGKVWIDDLQIEEGNKATDFIMKPVAGNFLTNSFDNIFPVGAKMNPELEIYTPEPDTDGKVNLILYDSNDNILAEKTYSFQTDDNRSATIKLPYDQLKLDCGLYIIRADYRLKDGFKDYDFYRFGFMKYLRGKHKHKNLSSSYMQPNMIPDFDTAAKKYMQMGLGLVRRGYVIPEKKLVERYKKYGIDVYSGILYDYQFTVPGDGRKWYNKNEIHKKGLSMKGIGVSDDPEFLQMVKKNAEEKVRKNPHVKVWCLVLEPAHILHEKPQELKRWIAGQKALAEGIKKADPNAKVIGMGPCTLFSTGGFREIVNFAEGGMLDFLDVVAAHPYRPRPDNPDLDKDTKRLADFLKSRGFKGEIWFTEGINYRPWFYLPRYGIKMTATTGNNFWRGGNFSYHLGYGEKLSAAYIARMKIIAMKYGVKNFDDNTPWYILDANRQLRLVCWAINTVGNILGDAKYIEDIDVGDGIRGYLFDDGRDRPVAVFWNRDTKVDDGLKKPYSITIPLSPDQVDVLSLEGKKLKFHNFNDVPVGPSPMFFVGKNIILAEFEKAMSDIVSNAGKRFVDIKVGVANENNLKIMLVNQRSKNISGNLTINCNDEKKDSKIDIEANGEKAVEMPLPPNIKMFDTVNVKAAFLLSGEKNSQEHEEEFVILFSSQMEKKIKIDGDLADWPAKYQVALADNHYEMKPSRKYLSQEKLNAIEKKDNSWHGKEDHSAVMYTAWDNDYFYLALDVKDDIFCPAPDRKRHYAYDSIQIYFDTFCDARSHDFEGYDENDYCYNIWAGKDGKMNIFRNTVPNQQLCFLKREMVKEGVIPAIFKKTAEGYIYEMAFPIRQIQPISLKKGGAFGFALIINENDGDYNKRTLSITPKGTHPYRRPDVWPVMILKK